MCPTALGQISADIDSIVDLKRMKRKSERQAVEPTEHVSEPCGKWRPGLRLRLYTFPTTKQARGSSSGRLMTSHNETQPFSRHLIKLLSLLLLPSRSLESTLSPSSHGVFP